MKTVKLLLVLALATAGTFAAQSAMAGGGHGHGHGHVSIGIGVGGWGYGGYGYRYGYGYPYYGYGWGYPYAYAPYYSAPVVLQQQPTYYVEQPQAQPQSQAPSGYWYFCQDSNAYYPYVKECPAGWQRVAPQPHQ